MDMIVVPRNFLALPTEGETNTLGQTVKKYHSFRSVSYAFLLSAG